MKLYFSIIFPKCFSISHSSIRLGSVLEKVRLSHHLRAHKREINWLHVQSILISLIAQGEFVAIHGHAQNGENCESPNVHVHSSSQTSWLKSLSVLFYCLFSATFLHLCVLVILLFKVTPRHSAEVLSHVREVQEVRAARDVPAVQREWMC